MRIAPLQRDGEREAGGQRARRTNGRVDTQARRSLLGTLSGRVGYRARSLILALVLAIVAVLLANGYLTSYKESVERGAAEAAVFVAARDIPEGTEGGDLVARKLVARRMVPRRGVVPGAIADLAQVRRLVASEPVYAGEQISTRRFRPAAERGLRGALRGNLRAMTVTGEGTQVLGGIVRKGDRVDVVASVKRRGASGDGGGSQDGAGASEGAAARVILRDLLVLEAPEEDAERGVGAGKKGPEVVLALTDSQVQRLFFAMKNGDWSLVLRPGTEAADSPDSVETAESVLGAGIRR